VKEPPFQAKLPTIDHLLALVEEFRVTARRSYPGAQRRARRAYYQIEDFLWAEEIALLREGWRYALRGRPERLEQAASQLRRRIERRAAAG
jgi:hypothetical protein